MQRAVKSNIKNPWTKSEDAMLSSSVHKFGPTNWQQIANQLETLRTAKQCRERWHNHLTGCVVKGNWSQEEDNVILKVQSSFGNQWAQITRLLPGRTDNAVKNRFHVLVRAGLHYNITSETCNSDSANNSNNNILDDSTTICDTNTASNYTSSSNTSDPSSSNITDTSITMTSISSNSINITTDINLPSQLQQNQQHPITAKNLEMLQMHHNYGRFSSNTSFSSGSVVSTASDEIILYNKTINNNNNNNDYYNHNNDYYNNNSSSNNSTSSTEYFIECEILDYLATELLCDKL